MTELGAILDLAREVEHIKAELEWYYNDRLCKHTEEIIDMKDKLNKLENKLQKIEKQIYAINKRLDSLSQSKTQTIKVEHEKI